MQAGWSPVRFCWLTPGRASGPLNFAPEPIVRRIKGQPANSGSPGKTAVKTVCACADKPKTHEAYCTMSVHF